MHPAFGAVVDVGAGLAGEGWGCAFHGVTCEVMAVNAALRQATALRSVRQVTLTTVMLEPPVAVHDPSGFFFTSITWLMPPPPIAQ